MNIIQCLHNKFLEGAGSWLWYSTRRSAAEHRSFPLLGWFMSPLLNTAVGAARAAGDFIMRHYQQADQLKVTTKQANDFVSEVDRSAEAIILDRIHRAYPSHAILAEESGEHGSNDMQWIIDPLDGTTNFLHRNPQFAVSIAARDGKELQIAVVYAPYTQELFTAVRGNGAQLDGRRIRVSNTSKLSESLIGTGFPYRQDQDIDSYLPMLKSVMQNTAGVRRPGAAALDLAYIAAGRLDGFWEQGLQPWDIAAGALLIKEAGGKITELYDPQADVVDNGNVLAGNQKIHAELEQLLQPFQPAPAE